MEIKDFDYSFVGYDTLYSASGEIELPMLSRACFGNIFHQAEISGIEHYKIFLRFGSNPLEGRDNVCLLDKNDIITFLEELVQYYKFNFSIEEGRDKKDTEGYFLNLDIEGPKIAHKFILSCIRYLYEHPYTFMLDDAIHLSKLKDFKDISLLNLIMLICTSNCISKGNAPLDYWQLHSLIPWLNSEYVVPIDSDKLKQNLKNPENTSVHELFTIGKLTNLGVKYRKLKDITSPTADVIRSYKTWNNPEYKLQRLKAYKNNRKILY